jgi:hypothetical protein
MGIEIVMMTVLVPGFEVNTSEVKIDVVDHSFIKAVTLAGWLDHTCVHCLS